ncbi:MAG: hypothetical protein AAF828_07190 [Bacteroidota bacterium]
MKSLLQSTQIIALSFLLSVSYLSAQTTVQLGEQCDCNAGRGPWTNTNNTAATTASSTIRFLGQNVGIGVNPVAPLQFNNNYGDDNSFNAYSDYKILLWRSGNAQQSYGLGIEGRTFAFNTYSDYDWNIQGNDRMTLTPTGLGLGVSPVAPLQFDNAYGDDNSFNAYSDYKILLFRSGNAQQSYGLGVEGRTFAFNTYADYDWNIQGSDRMTLTPTGLGLGVNPAAPLHFDNSYGDNTSFNVFSDYKILLWKGGNARQSYGIGIEGSTLAYNSYREFDWNIQGGDKMTLSPWGLVVNGNIRATGTITPDYVFEQYYDGTSARQTDYKMLDLASVKAFTQAHKHLPGVPSAAEIEAQGGIVLNRQAEIQLEKIEELFLHTIEQEEKIETLTEMVLRLEAALTKSEEENKTLARRVLALEKKNKE